MNVQLAALVALTPREQLPVHTEWDIGWEPQQVRTVHRIYTQVPFICL